MILAEYSDAKSYHVLYDKSDGKTYLATTDGKRMTVPFFLNGASFVRYALGGSVRNLRSCDAFELLCMLTPPQPPTHPAPIPAPTAEDTRLHLEPRTSGQSSFGQLQSAAAKVEAQARAERERARVEAQTPVDPHQVRRTRDLNNQFAELRKPRGGGGSFLVKKGE